MKSIKNVPDYPEYLRELIICSSHQVSSKKLVSKTKCDISIIAFGEGEVSSDITNKGETMYICVSGVATIAIDGTDYRILPGQTMIVEAGMEHQIKGEDDYKVVQIIAEV